MSQQPSQSLSERQSCLTDGGGQSSQGAQSTSYQMHRYCVTYHWSKAAYSVASPCSVSFTARDAEVLFRLLGLGVSRYDYHYALNTRSSSPALDLRYLCHLRRSLTVQDKHTPTRWGEELIRNCSNGVTSGARDSIFQRRARFCAHGMSLRKWIRP